MEDLTEKQGTALHPDMYAWGKDISPKLTPKAWSEDVGKLIEAITQAQLEFDAVKKEQTNPFFKSKYADLSTVLGATQKQLAKFGVYIAQFPFRREGTAGVRTVAFHKSGAWIDYGDLAMPLAKQDAQGVGSGITYSRRYSYQAAAGVSAEEDDDGNAAVSGNGKSPKQHEEDFDQRGAPGRIKQFQVNAFLTACAENGKTEKQITGWLKTLGKVQAEELTPEEFQKGLKWAHGKEELTETLKSSVKATKKPKEPEPEGVPLAWDKQTTITDEDIPF